MSVQSDFSQNSNTNQRMVDKKWALLCAAIAIGAVLSRFLFLDEKPFHHDESLHAYYSNRVAQGQPHEYSALLHGPVLYYLTGAFMAAFGASEYLARVPAALCNVALVLLPLLWTRFIGRPAAAALSILLLLSPTLMYFGRFLREDAFNSLWIVGCLSSFCAYLVSQRPRYAILASAFLALQFCNKENSYLHLFVWLSGYYFSLILMRMTGDAGPVALDVRPAEKSTKSERIIVAVNCVVVFSAIFILFYSSFFRHSKGALHGVLDGLYRESLLYWWDQNQKRRIDGPFDYHIPIFLNYEFALIPAIVFAWLRSVRLAVTTRLSGWVGVILRLLTKPGRVYFLFLAALTLLMLPRVGLSPAGCSISEYCATEVLSQSTSKLLGQVAKVLHIAHTRHLIQLILMIVFGAFVFLASVQLRRVVDSFLWWWLTGAVGIYSYVGEKVPWLLVYIILPAILVAGIEMGRQWSGEFGQSGHPLSTGRNDQSQQVGVSSPVFPPIVSRIFLLTTAFLLVFASFKAIRVSFLRPESPHERLVFTQTTPSIQKIRIRWVEMMGKSKASPKISISGDATWPMSWYSYDISKLSFSRPKDAEEAAGFDAVFLDRTDLDFAYNNMNSFDIFEVPLRHWWVPQPNPGVHEILEYFLTGRPYPRELHGNPVEQGIGDTTVLYLENKSTGRFFSKAKACDCGQVLRSAQLQLND